MPHKSKNAQAVGAVALKETEHMDEGRVNTKSPANVVELVNTRQSDEEVYVDSLPPWLDANELIAKERETPEILIGGQDGNEKGAVLRRGAKLVVGGGSKMGKTWSLIDLGLAVAAGGKWLGHFQCKQGAVLYVNLELKPHTAGRRVNWIAKERGYTEGLKIRSEVSKSFQTWNLRGHCYDIVTMLASARMRLSAPGAPKFALIILDPIYKTYGGRDENAAGDMASLMLELEQFADKCGAAIAFAAHFSKGNQAGKEAMDRISGSGVMARDPDAIITFTNHEEEDCYTMDAILREFAPLPQTVFHWSAPVMNPRTDLDPAKLRQAGKAAKSVAPGRAQAVREVLLAHGGTLARGEAIRLAIEKTKDNRTVDAWEKSFETNEKALLDAGIQVEERGSGVSALYHIKTAKKKGANDPF